MTIAFTLGFTRSISRRCAAITSRADSFFCWISLTISVAFKEQISFAGRISWRKGEALDVSRSCLVFIGVRLHGAIYTLLARLSPSPLVASADSEPLETEAAHL